MTASFSIRMLLKRKSSVLFLFFLTPAVLCEADFLKYLNRDETVNGIVSSCKNFVTSLSPLPLKCTI